jgi:peptidoglycan/LPS O-acetylase OafA/YrhL
MAVVAVHAVRSSHAISFGHGETVFGRALWVVLSYGNIGVFLFFVISGFCIHLRWAGRDGDDRSPSFVAFWKRRIFRLYPPYLVALAIYVALDSTHRHLDSWFAFDVGLHLIMAHNLTGPTTYSLNLVFWTLAIEEQLYLLYFALLIMRRRWGWPVTVALCFGARVAWFVLALMLHRGFGLFLPVQESAAAQWFVWTLGAVSIEYALGHVRLPAFLTRLEVGLGLLLATCTLYKLEDPGGGTIGAKLVWFFAPPLYGVAFFVVVNALTCPEVAGAAPAGWMRPWARVGIFSYSLYLVHELVVTYLRDLLVAEIGRPDLKALLGLTLIPAAMALGWGYYLLIERRFIRSPARVLTPAANLAPEHDHA